MERIIKVGDSMNPQTGKLNVPEAIYSITQPLNLRADVAAQVATHELPVKKLPPPNKVTIIVYPGGSLDEAKQYLSPY